MDRGACQATGHRVARVGHDLVITTRGNLSYTGLFFFFHKTCYILLPQLGMEPMPPAVEAQSLNHWTTREVSRTDFILFILIHSQKQIILKLMTCALYIG